MKKIHSKIKSLYMIHQLIHIAYKDIILLKTRRIRNDKGNSLFVET